MITSICICFLFEIRIEVTVTHY